jgi:F420-dependent oxidoreductase-like protein
VTSRPLVIPSKGATMLLGLHVQLTHPGRHGNHFDTLLAVVRACEQAGLDSVWMMDHFMFPDADDPAKEVPMLECFVTLGALAAATTRLRLGQLVVGVPYRNPALLAKMCATLDVISHGRTIVGLGAGWHEPEFSAYGWPFPAVRERMELLEETVQIVDRMLTQRPASFRGKHYAIQDAFLDPMPVQQPRPPIMIGGSGEQVTLRLVAQYADYCNVFGDPAEVARLFGVLRQHCNAVGRPYETITRSSHTQILIARDQAELAAKQARFPESHGIVGTPDMVVEQLAAYAQAGSQLLTFNMPDTAEIDSILLLGEQVLPRVAAL